MQRQDEITTSVIEQPQYKIELEAAIVSGNLESIKDIIKEHPESLVDNLTENMEWTLRAIKHGHLNIVKYFIETLAIPTTHPDLPDSNALICAAAFNKEDIVKYLISEQGMDMTARGTSNITCLHLAVANGNLSLVQFLLEECKMPIGLRTENGTDCLLASVLAKQTAITKYLIEEQKMPLQIMDKNGNGPIHVAIIDGNLELVKYLLQKDPSLLMREWEDNEPRSRIIKITFEYKRLAILKYILSIINLDLPLLENIHTHSNNIKINSNQLYEFIKQIRNVAKPLNHQVASAIYYCDTMSNNINSVSFDDFFAYKNAIKAALIGRLYKLINSTQIPRSLLEGELIIDISNDHVLSLLNIMYLLRLNIDLCLSETKLLLSNLALKPTLSPLIFYMVDSIYHCASLSNIKEIERKEWASSLLGTMILDGHHSIPLDHSASDIQFQRGIYAFEYVHSYTMQNPVYRRAYQCLINSEDPNALISSQCIDKMIAHYHPNLANLTMLEAIWDIVTKNILATEQHHHVNLFPDNILRLWLFTFKPSFLLANDSLESMWGYARSLIQEGMARIPKPVSSYTPALFSPAAAAAPAIDTAVNRSTASKGTKRKAGRKRCIIY